MNGLFIQQTAPNVFGQPSYREDLLTYSQEDLLADNWYRLITTVGVPFDINQTEVVTYEIRNDGIVYQVKTLVPKEGEALNTAIRQKWFQIRLERLDAISKTDWTQMSDSPLTAEQKATWATYRQALRDITMQSDPFNITWPTDPNGRTNQIGVARV
jgi:hypothetical protein